jgi:hypothetical protein
MMILQILTKKPAKGVQEAPINNLKVVFSQASINEHEKGGTIESKELKGDISKRIAVCDEVSTEVGEAVNGKKLEET